MSEEITKSYSVNVSVRQLVEFVLRSGDIDNRKSAAATDSAMQEGSRLHRMIQRRMGDNYYPEVLLRYKYNTDRYVINIEGRADGIILGDNTYVRSDSGVNKQELLTEQEHLTDYFSEDILRCDELGKYEIARADELFEGHEAYEELKHEVMASRDHLRDEDSVTIDEIKCVARSLEYINRPVPVHLAQAKVYAFIYGVQKGLSHINIRMSYCNMETEEMKYFYEDYSIMQLTAWFYALMNEYSKWADFQYEWQQKRTLSIKNMEFPFSYREGQKELCVSVYKTIYNKKKLFIQAPTGVGKTLSTVFPSVKAMGEGLSSKIFYLTAKTITRTVAEDTFDILRNVGLVAKTLTITAKEKICPLEKAECNPGKCPCAKGHYDRVNDAIYEAITAYDRIDRDVILEVAEKYMVCPFELSLDISLFCDAVICDYNYVFDPHASLKRFFSDGMKGDYTFLIDEAHNLVERGRDMFSAALHKEDFLALKRSVKAVLDDQPLKKQLKKPSIAARLVKALERCNKELLRLKRECRDCLILETADPFAGLVESLRTVMDQFLEEEDDSPVRQEVLEFYFEVCHFLLIYEKLSNDYVIYCELNQDDIFMFKLFCVDPKENLKDAMGKGRSSILFSATFLPIQYYKGLLGGEAEDYEIYAKSTFNNKRRGLFIAGDVTSKYTRRNEMEYHKIASYIFEITSAKTGNYMVFFPSHAFLASVLEAFTRSFYDERDTQLLVQGEFMNEEMREEFLSKFVAGDKTLIGFCVLGGIFSEGIDLKADSLIGAIIVGTGLPMVCNEREILKEYFDDENASGFDYAYRYPGMNKVLQAAGRVIRTQEDIGVVALLDDRFKSPANRRLFPREWENIKYVSNLDVGEQVEDFWRQFSGRITDGD